MKQYIAKIEGKENSYFKDSEGKIVFSKKEDLLDSLESSNVTGALIYSREVTEWEVVSELMR